MDAERNADGVEEGDADAKSDQQDDAKSASEMRELEEEQESSEEREQDVLAKVLLGDKDAEMSEDLPAIVLQMDSPVVHNPTQHPVSCELDRRLVDLLNGRMSDVITSMTQNFSVGDYDNSALAMDSSSDSAPRIKIDKTGRVIKRRRRNRFGDDTTHMGFQKVFVVNELTGRNNQLFKCLRCPIKTPKLCNMLDHQKTHRPSRRYKPIPASICAVSKKPSKRGAQTNSSLAPKAIAK